MSLIHDAFRALRAKQGFYAVQLADEIAVWEAPHGVVRCTPKRIRVILLAAVIAAAATALITNVAVGLFALLYIAFMGLAGLALDHPWGFQGIAFHSHGIAIRGSRMRAAYVNLEVSISDEGMLLVSPQQTAFFPGRPVEFAEPIARFAERRIPIHPEITTLCSESAYRSQNRLVWAAFGGVLIIGCLLSCYWPETIPSAPTAGHALLFFVAVVMALSVKIATILVGDRRHIRFGTEGFGVDETWAAQYHTVTIIEERATTWGAHVALQLPGDTPQSLRLTHLQLALLHAKIRTAKKNHRRDRQSLGPVLVLGTTTNSRGAPTSSEIVEGAHM
jgi:hypothetical protein